MENEEKISNKEEILKKNLKESFDELRKSLEELFKLTTNEDEATINPLKDYNIKNII